LWFTTQLGRGIGRMATNGQSRIFPFDREHSGIATGPDGALWFLVRFRDFTVGRMTTDGHVSTFTAPSPPGDPLTAR